MGNLITTYVIMPELDCWFNVIPFSTVYLAKNHEYGFCGSLSQALCNLRVVFWRHWLIVQWATRANQCLSSSVWNALSTKKVHSDPKWI